MKKTILVAGAGGFIGGHFVKDLLNQGCRNIRAVDVKPVTQWYQCFSDAENIEADLSDVSFCQDVCSGVNSVYNFAADMGGMGFIENNKALCMLSVLINSHLLVASRDGGVSKYFYASSACVYNAEKQDRPDISPLKESDAYPAMPEDGYGWEKLFSERMCRHFHEDYDIETTVARFHNIYGPHGTWDGGREKAPAAICRKVIEAVFSGNHQIEIWGDGNQTRSFTFIDDCVVGINKLVDLKIREPVNVGSSEMVSINQLVDIVEEIAGIKLKRNYILSAPKGVNGRNSDNTLIRKLTGWEPSTRLKDGMRKTYDWIRSEMESNSCVDSYRKNA